MEERMNTTSVPPEPMFLVFMLSWGKYIRSSLTNQLKRWRNTPRQILLPFESLIILSDFPLAWLSAHKKMFH